ncbi:MAG: flagellar FlbD family protein [Peptococcaceae bacterium]|nr:flagellar FlbD family protein [Peptococcaceae bacterium]
MITLTKLNGCPFVLNSDLIETIEENPDTTIRLTSKNFYIVKEPMEEVVEKVIQFRRATFDVLNRIARDY